MTLADKAKRIVNGDDTTFEYNNEIFVVEQPPMKSIVIDSKGNKAISPKMYNMTDYQGTAAALQEYRQNLLFDKNGNLIDKFKKGKKIKSHIYKRGSKIYNRNKNLYDKNKDLSKGALDEIANEIINDFENEPEELTERIKNVDMYLKDVTPYSSLNEYDRRIISNKIKKHFESKNEPTDEDYRDMHDTFSLRENYPHGRTPQWIWDNWTHEQRSHFLYDHDLDSTSNWNKNYDELNDVIKNALKTHIKQGRYENGTKIESTNERNENYYENVVNELLNDNAIATIRMKTYGCEIQPYSPVDDAYMLPIKLTRSDLLALIIKSNVEFMNYDEKQILNELQSMTRLLMKK